MLHTLTTQGRSGDTGPSHIEIHVSMEYIHGTA